MTLPLVVAMTGASGAVYAVRLLQQLLLAEREVHLVFSPSAVAVFSQELKMDLSMEAFDPSTLLRYRWPGSEQRWTALDDESVFANGRRLLHYHHYRDYMTPIASGSFLTAGMIICPCSGSTLSGVVHASGDNLIQRAADVHLKEHRKLVLVPRETPLSVFQIENMRLAASAGAVVLPAMPGWYHGVESLVDLIDFVVARILDHVQVPHQLMRRWGDDSP